MKINNTITKIIYGFLLIAILAPGFVLSMPKEASALSPLCTTADGGPCQGAASGWLTKFFTASTSVSTATSASFDAKQWAEVILKHVLQAFARRLLAQMTQSTVNWINSGFHGSPLFVERPGAFFKDIAKYEIKNLVQLIGYDNGRYPFGKSTIINTIQSYKRQFQTNAQYSLSKVTRDPQLLQRYRTDFSYGGWDGFLLNTQYPQNNYLGFQMLYKDELGSRLRGTTQSEAEVVRDTLQQGLGFLSPQTCPSNPNYNNLKNQFQQPVFKYGVPPPKFDCGITPPSSDTEAYEAYNRCEEQYRQDEIIYESDRLEAQAEWSKTNSCPGGLVSTTPGSVVSAQIMKAVTGPYDQTSLAAAMGNSLSAVFDALLNKFMNEGLNSLSSKISGQGNNNNNNDDFDYYGYTLGSPVNSGTNTGTGFDWNGPDGEIILADLKREVQTAIDNGNKELNIINSTNITSPGFLQYVDTIVSRTQELDMCVPGPNFGWEERVDAEVQRKESTETATTLGNAFKSWLPPKMKTELPSSGIYLSSVNSIKETNKEKETLTKREETIRETLVKLESIKASLSSITTQPTRGSENEKTMVRLKQRMQGMLLELSTASTVTEAQNILDDAKDKMNNLNSLITKCTTERQVKGWSNPGGASSVFNNTTSEKETFCTSFIGATLNCDVIFTGNKGDYTVSDAGPIGGGLNPVIPTIPENSTPKLGTCIKGLTIKQDITENECSSTLGGVWIPNQQ